MFLPQQNFVEKKHVYAPLKIISSINIPHFRPGEVCAILVEAKRRPREQCCQLKDHDLPKVIQDVIKS